jgi:misacylated tRNA(Ala) deacylase
MSEQTTQLFETDAYLTRCTAKVIKVNPMNGIVLDQTVFYPTGGGQPGDQGSLLFNQQQVEIVSTIKDRETGEIVHVPASDEILPQVGDAVTAQIDWENRYLHMRMHTALHLLCAVVPCGVTGGQIGTSKSRLDFDIGDSTLDKVSITDAINQLVQQSHSVSTEWVDDEMLEQNPELVRTMSVKPPKGAGKVRLLRIGEKVDLQPCGGTHVKSTAEIGEICVSKIENKGKRNRRVNIVFA